MHNAPAAELEPDDTFKMDPLFQEGVVSIELSQLVAEEYLPYGASPAADLTQLLTGDCILDVRITSKARDAVLAALQWSSDRLLKSQEAPYVPSVTVYCPANVGAVHSARDVLGSTHRCKVRLHCIPRKSCVRCFKVFYSQAAAQPRSVSDGDVFRNVRYYMAEGRYPVADAWLNKLSPCKKKIMQLILRRKPIMDAMDNLLPFSGLWAGLEIGNWAKHLAAHCDELIINYWQHMHRHWEAVCDGLENQRHLIDYPTVQRLHRRNPSLCQNDRRQIENDFASQTNPLFPRIPAESHRDRLKQNILAISVMIPSIDTFHDNMRYMTIGAKILEKHVQAKTKKVSTTTGNRVSLFESLRADWTSNTQIQTDHADFRDLADPTTAETAYMQLFIAALRYFPFLSQVAPLQDSGGVSIVAEVKRDYLVLLCRIAKQIGFSNEKIEALCAENGADPRWELPETEKPCFWRGGKPSYSAFRELWSTSFLPGMLRLEQSTSQPENLPVLYFHCDILKAFFGGWPDGGVAANVLPSATSVAGGKRKNSVSFQPERMQKRRHGDETVDRRRRKPDTARDKTNNWLEVDRCLRAREQGQENSPAHGHASHGGQDAAPRRATPAAQVHYETRTTDTFAIDQEVPMLDLDVPDVHEELSAPGFSAAFDSSEHATDTFIRQQQARLNWRPAPERGDQRPSQPVATRPQTPERNPNRVRTPNGNRLQEGDGTAQNTEPVGSSSRGLTDGPRADLRPNDGHTRFVRDRERGRDRVRSGSQDRDRGRTENVARENDRSRSPGGGRPSSRDLTRTVQRGARPAQPASEQQPSSRDLTGTVRRGPRLAQPANEPASRPARATTQPTTSFRPNERPDAPQALEERPRMVEGLGAEGVHSVNGVPDPNEDGGLSPPTLTGGVSWTGYRENPSPPDSDTD